MRSLRIILGMAIIVGAAAIAAIPVFATDQGGVSVEGYAADTPLDNGTIVQLSGKSANRVQIAAQAGTQNMFGVTVDRNQLPIAITNEGLENQVFVAVSGTYNVLVSTQHGAIKAGDYVTLSSVNGVAMKAGTNDENKTVLGRAGAAFDDKGVVLGTAALKDATGKTSQTVTLGMIPVTIDIRDNPNKKSTKVKVPSFLERTGLAIAEKEVSPIRVYLSIAIAVACLVATIAILYSGVRSGVISIGRNPMSKKSIFRALIELILTCILILAIGLFAVYLLLRL